MSLSGVTSQAISTYQTKLDNISTEKAAETTATANVQNDTAIVYEKSASASEIKGTYGNAKSNKAIVEQLKADAAARKESLVNMVQQMMGKQSSTFQIAFSANPDSIWNEIRQGNFQADAQTIAQAQKDVSEDGYWGVKQTSERILDFAKAISGGDSSRIDELTEAINKGFKQAEGLWGDKLPEISQKTYDAVMEGMDAWKAEVTSPTVEQ